MYMQVRSIFAIAATTVLALGACASGTGSSTATSASPSPSPLPAVTTSPTPSPSPSASASPSPTPTPTSTSTSAPEGPPVGNPCSTPGAVATGLPAIDFNRYANICLGMSFAEATAAMPGPTIAGRAECPWYAEVLAVDDPGLYVAAVTFPENPGDEIFLFRMIWIGDPADAASFAAPATQQGISVGSTTAQVNAAYPSATGVTLDDPSRGTRNQLVVAGADGTSLVFDVTSGRVDSMYWGDRISNGAAGELCAL